MYTKYTMAEKRSSRNNKALDPLKNNERSNNMPEVTKPTSLSSLIQWNISKALQKNPAMDLKSAVKAAHRRLDRERDVSAMIPDSPEQRHLACAVLAWQQLGHSDTDSLCMFIANIEKTQECTARPDNSAQLEVSKKSSHESEYSKDVHSMSFGTNSIGPVVKLPVETKIVMRMENSPSARQTPKKPRASEKNTMNKIEAACCIDSACAARLAKMDTATTELRMRAGTLAKREAERVELLERAEDAWRDLELGYQRRLALTEEKEEDLLKQIQKAIQERNGFKNACTTLALQLKEKGEKAEKERAALSLVEKEVCERACLRLKLSEESAQTDAVLAEHQCRAAQLERDLQFKEEQARRKLLNFQSELESSQTLTLETERAMRAELGGLREQIAQVSEQLLEEHAVNARTREELESLRQEKMGMVEDLEGCKTTCDSHMQRKVDELKKKREQLAALKDKVMECRCKLPVDATVEVKRTASLAALCHCTPEQKIMESCSCTSLRGSLLSNLLGDLFSGLQSEMGGTGVQMPCQLLKCLEDKHNWDRASIVKTNLKDYFAQLLIRELDIAIATSIEKYHAKWVGKSCADATRMIPDPGEAENEGWQERAIERRAQKLATKLAEQLFQERADQLTQRAKDIVASGPPPCACKPQSVCCKEVGAAVFPVLVRPRVMSPTVNGATTPAHTPAYWRQTMQDVTQLRVQIEDLKKDSIKKEDLKLMEEKITKIVQQGSGTGKNDIRQDDFVSSNKSNDVFTKKEQKYNKASSQSNYYMNLGKPTSMKKKQIETNSYHKKVLKPTNIQNNGPEKTFKTYKKPGQTYAINMCMCSQKDPNNLKIQNNISIDAIIEEKGRKDKDSIPQMTSSVRQTKPINASLKSQDILARSKSKSGYQSCQSNCKCFHKIPSNTSIDKLLETLAKWKSDLNPCEIEKECKNEIPCCNFLPGNEINSLNYKEDMKNEFSNPVCCKQDAENENICTNSLTTIQKENAFPDIGEKSKDNSKMSTRSSSITEKSAQIKNSKNPCFDKRSSIKIKSFGQTPSDLNKNKNMMSSNTNEITADFALKLNDTNSKNRNEIFNLGEAACNDSNILANNLASGYVAPTESEYMGAINLDKSNEDFCKCVRRNEANSDPPNEPYQCMPCKCSCKSLKTKTNVIHGGNAFEILPNGGVNKNKSQKIENGLQRNSPCEMIRNLQSKSDRSNKMQSEVFPCDCGYDIKFLGVTLTDIISTNQKEPLYNEKRYQLNEKSEKKGSGYNSHHQISESKNVCGYNENNTHTSSSKAINIKKCNLDKKNTEKEAEKSKVSLDGNINHRTSSEKSNNNKTEVNDQDNIRHRVIETNNDIHIIDESRVKCEKCQLLKKTNLKVESCKSTTSCECKVNLDGFKNNIDISFKNQLTNEDKGLDVQSIKENNIEEESCVCCDKQNLDESQDLEKNTFHLLEEHLKKKLDEFKESSCNSTCIPPEEEEKLFATILQRVRQVIAESTNKITCKCVNEEGNTKGSWNRAYGLLQEYLKTKIQHVQCACVLTDENSNSNTILPEVLGKVCNLIEDDFQRLKDVCECKKLDLQNKDNKQVYFKDDIPERDNNGFINNNMTEKKYSCCTQNSQTSLVQENNSSQVPAYFEMETKACNPLEIYVMNDTNNCSCGEKKVDAELIGTIETEKLTASSYNNESNISPTQFSNASYVAYVSECICKSTECLETDVLNTTSNQTGRTADTELLGVHESKTKQLIDSVDPGKKTCMCDPHLSACCQKNGNVKTDDTNRVNIANFPNKPYIGYTIDCSCNTALGACICTKSLAQADNDAVDSIIKASLPNDKYYKKVSYILKSNPTDNTIYHNDLSCEMTGDLYLHNFLKHKTLYDDDSKQDCETEASYYDKEEIVLKNSREYFEMAHTTTNTFDDSISMNTDYSNSEAPLDWCECCSQIPPHENNNDLLKKSLYFPAPLEHDNHLESNIKKGTSEILPNILPKYCDCDLVPICHVKMLVENIESKLVSAKCTCDSMIPKVCPIHSARF